MDLIKILQQLKEIEPDPDYSKKSRALILIRANQERGLTQTPKTNYLIGFLRDFQSMRFALASEIAGFLIVIGLLAGFYYLNQNNKNNLVVQADEINASIQLKLNEIQYLLQNKNTRNSGINESLTTAATSLNNAAEDIKNDKIGDALEKIKTAQKIFEELEAKIK